MAALLGAGCSSGHTSAPAGRYTGPTARGAPNPLGAKWDWSRVDAFGPFLRRLSGGATFYDLSWCEIETSPGERNWSTVDEVASSSRALGITLYLKIRVGTCWATAADQPGTGGGTTAADRRVARRAARRATRQAGSSMPSDLGAYRGFVTAVVERYAPLGVHEYAIENEVNAPGHWLGTVGDYVRLVTAGAEAVRAADPKALVADGGLGSTVYGGALAQDLLAQGREVDAVAAYEHYYARRFAVRSEQLPQVSDGAGLRAALAGEQLVRNQQYFDATVDLAKHGVIDLFQLHFYEAWDQAAPVMEMIRRRLPVRMPVQAWEVGQFWPDAPTDPKVHADETTKVVCGLFNGGVDRVIWLPLAYNPAGRNASELRFGLLDPDGKLRPAASALLALRHPDVSCAREAGTNG